MGFIEGLVIVFQLQNIFLLVVGVVLGIIVGVIPGLTATLAISLLLPFTFGLEAAPALLMLVGIYIGGMYGGAITAVMLRTPGSPAAAATVLDGYPMMLRGEGGRALGVLTVGSFIGGTVSCIFLIFLSPIISRFALRFSSAEFFALFFFGLTIIFSVSGKTLLKGIIAGLIGLLVTTVGFDPVSGYPRFTFGIRNLIIGFPLLPAIIGLFAVGEAFRLFEKGVTTSEGEIQTKVGRIWPRWADLFALRWTYLKSSLIGTFIGALPGPGGSIAAFAAYGVAKRTSKTPELFGTGIIDGVAAPETANNAVTGGCLIPTLTLGVPGDAVTAVLLGAFTIQGLQPGPLLFRDNPEIVNSIFAGAVVGNFVMLVTGLLLATAFAKVANIRRTVLVPIIIVISVIGAYASESSLIHMRIAVIFGIGGYILEKLEFPVAPIALAIVLGSLAEAKFRQALIRSNGDLSIFFNSGISVVFLLLAVGSVVFALRKEYVDYKKEKAGESK